MYDGEMSSKIDADVEMRDRLIEISIVYEMFFVPDARRLTYRLRTVCALRIHTLSVLRATYAMVYSLMYKDWIFCCQCPTLIVIKVLPIAVRELFFIAVSCQLHSSDAWSLNYCINKSAIWCLLEVCCV